ncbi:hypothetical protein LTS08_004867 [Lithohypha guttulata]|nr:hypothetical protein LTS08_004867 [Lithohypha guttulata]
MDETDTESMLKNLASKYDDLQARVNELERTRQLPLAAGQRSELTWNADNTQVVPARLGPATSGSVQTSSAIRGKDKSTLISQFEAVQDFVASLRDDPPPDELLHVSRELHSLSRITEGKPCLHNRNLSIHGNQEDILAHMERLLPPVNTCHALTEIYFNYFEHCTRILHRGTTNTLFRAYFNKSILQERRALCVPTLLAVVSIASSLGTFPECDVPAVHGRVDGIGAYHLLRNHLEILSTKEWLETSILQIALLTLKFHKSSVLTDLEKWQWTGQILRRAMAAGLHKAEYADVDVFESEVKRRMWLTLLELDLTFAIASNMPANCPVWVGALPVNVDDGQLYPGQKQRPRGHGLELWTDGLCQHVLAQSFNDRLTAYQAVSSGIMAPYDIVLKHTRHLEQVTHDVPVAFRLDREQDEAANTPHRLMAKMELDFFLRRPLNACYAPYAAEMPQDDKYKEARIPWVQGCTISICFQDLFDPKFPTLDLPEPRGLWDYYHNVYKWDVGQYMLANCLELQRLRHLNTDGTDVPSPVFRGHALRTSVKVMGWTIEGILKSLEDTIDPLSRRIGRHGSDLRDVVKWTAVVGPLRMNVNGSRLRSITNELQNLTTQLKSRAVCEGHLSSTSYNSAEDDVKSHLEWLQDCLR